MTAEILLVHGDAAVCSLYADVLKRDGHNVQVLAAPESIERLLDRNSDSNKIDLLVLDVDLPDKMGPKVAWALREKGHSLPIVGLKTAGDTWDPEDLADLGFNRLLDKPVTGMQLIESVRELTRPNPNASQAQTAEMSLESD